MKLKFTSCLILLIGSSYLFSCDSKDEITAVPNASSSLFRSVSFINPESIEELTYTGDSLSTMAQVYEGNLIINVDTRAYLDEDQISFFLDQSFLESPLQEFYPIESIPDNSDNDVRVYYTYDPMNYSGSMYLSFSESMSGKFIITEYDRENDLISGKYELLIPNVFDPKTENPDSKRRADISLKGEFRNIKVQ